MSSINSTATGTTYAPDFTALQKNVFNKADTDGDGYLTTDELQSLLDSKPRLAQALSGLATSSSSDGSAPSASDVMKALDSDGDGKVSAAELASGMAKARKTGGGMPPPPPPDDSGSTDGTASNQFTQMLQGLFSSGDTDGDGSLTQSDLETMMQQVPGLARDLGTLTSSDATSDTGASDIFKKLDTDGDGKISATEFTSAVTQAHDKIVANWAAASGSDSSATTDATDTTDASTTTVAAASVQTLLLELWQRLQQRTAGYGPDGTATSATSTSENSATLNTVA